MSATAEETITRAPTKSEWKRDWARANGFEVKEQGRLPGDANTAAEAAWDDLQAALGDYPGDPGEDGSGPYSDPDGHYEGEPEETPTPPRGGGWWASIGRARAQTRGKTGTKRKPRQPRPRSTHKRLSVSRFIEDTYMDIAQSAGGIPPLQRLLYAQAPIAGTVLDPTIKDTVVDRVLLQPAAHFDEQYKALSALLGAPIMLVSVMATAPQPIEGEFVPVVNEHGQEVTDPETLQPVMMPKFEPASMAHKTAMVGLHYCIGAMVDVAGESVDRVVARAQARTDRDRRVDQFMAYILGMPPPPVDSPPPYGEAMAEGLRLVGADDQQP